MFPAHTRHAAFIFSSILAGAGVSPLPAHCHLVCALSLVHNPIIAQSIMKFFMSLVAVVACASVALAGMSHDEERCYRDLEDRLAESIPFPDSQLEGYIQRGYENQNMPFDIDALQDLANDCSLVLSHTIWELKHTPEDCYMVLREHLAPNSQWINDNVAPIYPKVALHMQLYDACKGAGLAI